MIEQKDWSQFCYDCEDIAYNFPEDAVLWVEDYRCIECFYDNVEADEDTEKELVIDA